MLIKIGDFDCTECWDGVFYKKLSSYPNITEWEIQTILDFITYESKYGRYCEIEADNQIINIIEKYKSNSKNIQRISVPDKITEYQIAAEQYRELKDKEKSV